MQWGEPGGEDPGGAAGGHDSAGLAAGCPLVCASPLGPHSGRGKPTHVFRMTHTQGKLPEGMSAWITGVIDRLT